MLDCCIPQGNLILTYLFVPVGRCELVTFCYGKSRTLKFGLQKRTGPIFERVIYLKLFLPTRNETDVMGVFMNQRLSVVRH